MHIIFRWCLSALLPKAWDSIDLEWRIDIMRSSQPVHEYFITITQWYVGKPDGLRSVDRGFTRDQVISFLPESGINMLIALRRNEGILKSEFIVSDFWYIHYCCENWNSSIKSERCLEIRIAWHYWITGYCR